MPVVSAAPTTWLLGREVVVDCFSLPEGGCNWEKRGQSGMLEQVRACEGKAVLRTQATCLGFDVGHLEVAGGGDRNVVGLCSLFSQKSPTPVQQ